MKSILVLTCLCFIGVTMVYGASKKELDFLTYYNGDFDNKPQTQDIGDNHDFIQVRLIPVDIKCLRPNPVVFVEESINNTTRVLVLAKIKDGIEDTVSLTIYSLSDSTQYKPGEYKVENLSNISCGDLHEVKDCIASYNVASEGYAYGNFQYCGATVSGKHPRFSAFFKCASVTASLPENIQQQSPMEPYELQLISQKYPLINPPKDYVSPCGN